MLVHVNRAVQGTGRWHARDLLQKSFLRPATSGAGLGANRTRADGQTSQTNQTSEVREVSEIAAVTAIAAALSTLQININRLCAVSRRRDPRSYPAPGRDRAESEEMKPQKITLAEMRDMGVRGLLIYCSDHKCSHLITMSGDRRSTP
jgi:hypothetical protein